MHPVPTAQPHVPPQPHLQREYEAHKEVQGDPMQDQQILQELCSLHGKTAEQETWPLNQNNAANIYLFYLLLVINGL